MPSLRGPQKQIWNRQGHKTHVNSWEKKATYMQYWELNLGLVHWAPAPEVLQIRRGQPRKKLVGKAEMPEVPH